MTINQNTLAKEIAECEGKKVEVDIAQVKEVLRVALEILAQHKASEVMALVEKHAKCP